MPHRDYDDMIPFEIRRCAAAPHRWQIAMAHGHYVPAPDRSIGLRPSWLIGDDEIAATGADYVALGHWNRAVRVGNGGCRPIIPARPNMPARSMSCG